jgi:enamine deaminase RidA (YjgF/YER057c/UK114 family)
MAAGLEPHYLSIGELAARPRDWWLGVLGVVGFDRLPPVAAHDVPLAASMTPGLNEDAERCEVWRLADGASSASPGTAATTAPATTTATAGEAAGAARPQLRRAGPWLFGALRLFEGDTATDSSTTGRQPSGAAALVRATGLAYAEIFAAIRSAGFPYLVRVWNYLPAINAYIDGDERYRHFNAARRTAFLHSGEATAGRVPAACALGSDAGSPLSIYFLAARQQPIPIENPRQTSAYHYPPRYGDQPPIFARASVLSDAGVSNLFVSGTASIVGHETRHAGDPAAQTRESFANIAAVLAQTNRVLGAQRFAMESLTFKVYVRKPADLACIKAETAKVLPRGAPIVYLRADVCREDLLVEIEASGCA